MYHFDLAQLHIFLTVCDAGSISAAAPRLFRSTSAISEQIRKLEGDLGVALLTRGKTGVRLTPGGERLLRHAQQLLRLSEQALADTRGETFEGEIRLAITDYFRPDMIAQLLKQLRFRYPRLRLHVAMHKSLTIEQAGIDFDIGLTMRYDAPPQLPDPLEIGREALQWVSSKDFDLDPTQPLPLLVLSGCAMLHYSCKMLEQAGVKYEIVYSTSGVAGLQSALKAGLGVACLNEGALPEGVGPISGGLPSLTHARFVLLPPKAGEPDFVGCVRQMLHRFLA
ncbi:TPA: LysR family transcriptional regulator [Pseudomonas aeruginosa]|uniref:LysR family transcriptional regulator n=1 Tax=Pseudomonas aeruginosa TaxID=287 RepID=UPI001369F685|nr:LysR family transcriptional regulator [Pseudomonas aeruginosa]MXU51443.1 LysR family transcriptional regulator [Pseudomonas aeruginosa]HBN9845797.1 LysR family transcriptional regulator [Pseudomonas aeruginosa]HBN9848338.1 LysR family transcriptional regulator [Pseudomonas aeruginosa]